MTETIKPIQIDGTSGGGQMLRSALTLAMVTGQPFRMTNIRGKRKKPGLMRQHLMCVRAACEVSGGTADGAEIGSTEIVFRAGELRGSSYHFAIGRQRDVSAANPPPRHALRERTKLTEAGRRHAQSHGSTV